MNNLFKIRTSCKISTINLLDHKMSISATHFSKLNHPFCIPLRFSTFCTKKIKMHSLELEDIPFAMHLFPEFLNNSRPLPRINLIQIGY